MNLGDIISNPLFQVILLFVLASSTWFVMNDESKKFKQSVLTFVTDGLYYFILITFGLNFLLHFREVINEPYRILLFSSEISWVSLIITLLYLGFREYKKSTYFSATREKYVSQILNFLLLLGLFNHLFYYYKYRSFSSVLFIVIYFIFYLFQNQIKTSFKNEFILLALALLHAAILYGFSSIVIYYQLVFYPYQLISLFVLASLLLFYFRRNSTSKQT